MNVSGKVPRPITWLIRIAGWTLALVIIGAIVLSYGDFKLSHQIEECLMFPTQPRSPNTLVSTKNLLACTIQKGGFLERLLLYRHLRVISALPNVPCPYVGTWTASRPGTAYKVTLRDDSQFYAEPMNDPQGVLISGAWGFYKDSLVWLYDESDDAFTLVEADGSITRYVLLERKRSTNCQPMPARSVAKGPAKAQQTQAAPPTPPQQPSKPPAPAAPQQLAEPPALTEPQQLSGPPPAGNPAELGLWESAMKMSRRGAPPEPTASVDAMGPMAVMLGATLKTVKCEEKPFEHLFYSGECKAQIEQGSGQCIIERSHNEGGSVSKEVRTINGNYKTALRVDTVFTRVYNFAPDKPAIDDSTIRYRYLGPCKPGMGKGDTFIVKENGEWVTEQQLDQERRQRVLERQKTRR
jgi:hypothetical protein